MCKDIHIDKFDEISSGKVSMSNNYERDLFSINNWSIKSIMGFIGLTKIYFSSNQVSIAL